MLLTQAGMCRKLTFVGLTLITVGLINPVQAQEEQHSRPWWIGLQSGVGQLQLTSDQFHGGRNATFRLGFVGGHSLGDRARIGLELNGWLLQAFNLGDPSVGESVSNALLMADVFPIRRSPLFVRAGAGFAMYQNNRPLEFNSTGWSWTAGMGYEFRIREQLGLAPIVDYASGSLGGVRNAIVTDTGRRYSVVEFRAAFIWHFGKPKS